MHMPAAPSEKPLRGRETTVVKAGIIERIGTHWHNKAHRNVVCQPDLPRSGLQYKRAFFCMGLNRS